MKKFIVTTLLVSALAVTNLFAQTANDVPLKEINIEYIQISGVTSGFSKKRTIEVEFGKNHDLWDKKEVKIKDENGEEVEFPTMIDALNFFSKNGYDFVTNSVVVNNPSINTRYIIMRKRENQPTAAVEKQEVTI